MCLYVTCGGPTVPWQAAATGELSRTATFGCRLGLARKLLKPLQPAESSAGAITNSEEDL